MRQMKKKIIIAVIVTLLLTATVAFVINHFIVSAKEEEIASLKAQVVDTECIAFANDLEADSIITQSDLKTIKIKLASLPAGTYKVSGGNIKHMIVDEKGKVIESKAKQDLKLTKEDLVGRVVKSNISANTIVLDSLLYNVGEEPAKDERIQEFNFLQLPSDLNVNDYIDVRIQFPTGEDYSVLIGKKIEKISGENTIFVKLNEEEIMAMGSAIIEAYMQNGVRLYANKYMDPATQLFNEEIVDYVAKYEYAVEKLSKEKTEFELRKMVAADLKEEGLYTEALETFMVGEETIVGTANIVIHSGDVIDAQGTISTEEITHMVNIIKHEEELMIAKSSWEVVPQLMKDTALTNNPEISQINLEDLENEILAEYAGIKEEYVEEIKLADMQSDSGVLSFYKTMRVESRDQIIRSYPVREEVLMVIRNNPNLLETIKAEFDSTALLNTRVDEYKKLEAEYEAAFDEYTKEQIKQKMEALVDERTENVEKALQEEITAQKAERVAYLESLINE